MTCHIFRLHSLGNTDFKIIKHTCIWNLLLESCYFWVMFTQEKDSILNQWTFPQSVFPGNSARLYWIGSKELRQSWISGMFILLMEVHSIFLHSRSLLQFANGREWPIYRTIVNLNNFTMIICRHVVSFERPRSIAKAVRLQYFYSLLRYQFLQCIGFWPQKMSCSILQCSYLHSLVIFFSFLEIFSFTKNAILTILYEKTIPNKFLVTWHQISQLYFYYGWPISGNL